MKAVAQKPTFQAIKDLFRILFFLISIVALAAVKASSNEPGGLFDPVKWLQQEKDLSSEEAIALRDVVTIQYDVSLERPWGQSELSEQIQKRWANFRKHFCPAVSDVCKLNEDADLKEIAAALKTKQSVAQINTELNKHGSPLQLVRLMTVPGRLPEGLEHLDDFNFILGVLKQQTDGDGNSYFEIKQSILQDIGVYYLGFQSKVAYNYIAFGSGGELLLFDETVMGKALEVAPQWQKIVNKDSEPSDFLYLPNRLLKTYVESRRSASSQYQGLANLRGYEWLAYDEIKKLNVLVGTNIIRTISKEGKLVNVNKILLETLLHMQKELDPRWVSLLYFQQSYDQNALVLEQFFSPGIVDMIMRENLNALLTVNSYKITKTKTEWLRTSPLNYLKDEDFLQRNNSEFFNIAKKLNIFAADWTNLPARQKRALMVAAIYPSNMAAIEEVNDLDQLLKNKKAVTTDPVMPTMYRSFANIAASSDLSLLPHLADQIYQRRFTSIQ